MADAPPDAEPVIRATAMPADANPYGDAFVGWIIGQMALAAGSVASRLSGARCPVVAADAMQFTAPVKIGDELTVFADVAATGRTSMTIATQAWCRARHGETAAVGRFVLVAMADGRPRAISNEGTPLG